MKRRRTRGNCKSCREDYPRIDKIAFAASSAIIKGNVSIGEKSSVWFNAVIRGDMESVTIGKETNIQDGVIIHVDEGMPAKIGNRVTVGHNAVIHGATVGDDTVIGVGSVLLNDSEIGSGSVVAAGAVVKEGFKAPPASLIAGVPASIIGQVSKDLKERIKRNYKDYINLAKKYQNMECAAKRRVYGKRNRRKI